LGRRDLKEDTMMRHMTMVLVVIAQCAVLDGRQAATGGPMYVYSPRYVSPGGAIEVSGTRFGTTAVAGLTLISPTGDFFPLGITPITNGAFTRTFAVPATVPPGRYFVFVNDSDGRIAINGRGSITITPTSRPWYTFDPPTTSSGGTVTFTGGSFPASTTGVVVGLVDAANQATIIGTASVAAGSLTKTFTVPADLAPGAYFPFVRDAAQPLFALNIEGPIAVFNDALPSTVEVGVYPIGAAVNPATGRVYIPNGGDDTTSVFDGASRALIATIPIGELPCAIALNARTNRVYVANVNTNDVSVIDGGTNTVAATVPVGANPCAMGVVPSLNRVFVGNYAADTVTVIDGSTNAVIATIPVGRGPFGIAVNPVTARVYVVNGYDNSLSAIDAATLQIITTVPVGRAPDAIGVNPITNRIYAANFFSNTITVLNGVSHQTIATIPVGKEPDGVGVDWMTNRVYVSNYASNTVTQIDGATNTVVKTTPVGITPDGLAVDPLTGRVYISNSNSNNVSIIER
jgi:YVTN family beta-propeller protein